MNFYGYVALFLILVISLGTLASVTLISIDVQSIKESEIFLENSDFECFNGLVDIRTFNDEDGAVIFSGRQIICAKEWQFSGIHAMEGFAETKEIFRTHMGPSISLER